MRWLSQCSKEEVLILSGIIALAQQLDGDLLNYSRALTEMNRKYFDVHAPKRPVSLNPLPGSMAIQRSAPHARKRFGQA